MVEINTKQGKIKGFEIELKPEIGGMGSTDTGTVSVRADYFRIPYLRRIGNGISKCAFWKTRTFSKTKTFRVSWSGLNGRFLLWQFIVSLFRKWKGIWDGTQRTTGQPQHPSSFGLFLSISHIWPVTNAQKELYESGAWQFGSAEMQNGAALAKSGDVIVVALSYRLGVFGFLFGNWGLWDQIEGLKWVQVRMSSNRNPRTHIWSCSGIFGVFSIFRKTLNRMVVIVIM